jgi:methylglutaconyl-CoA hydratase
VTAGLRIDRDDRGVVTLTLDRPEVRNALDAELMGAIAEAAGGLATDASVRALVLTGAGTVFSAGADLTWMGAMAAYSFEENVADSRGFERMLTAVDAFPAPVIARVNGHAIAGASGLVACADIAVAVRGARFGFTEVQLGLVPAMISAYVVPRIGVSAARRYLLTGELFDADRAHQLGLVAEVCEPDELDRVVGELLDTIVRAGPAAQRAVKQLLPPVIAASRPEDTEQLRVEAIARARVSEEAQTRMRAFFERRRS